MRVGIVTPVVAQPPPGHAAWERDAGIEEIARIAETADRLGYHHVTCSEHVAVPAEAAEQRWIAGGCAHVAGPPHITLDGDEATAVGYTLMIVKRPDGFVLRRATANRWRLRRTPAGWRAVTRTNRVLDGREESPDLLASHFPQAIRFTGGPDGGGISS